MTRLLTAVVALAARRPSAMILLALALAAAASAYAAGRFEMSSDATALISADVPWRAAENRLDAAFPANGDITLVVIDGATSELAERAARSLGDALSSDRRHFRSVTRPDGGDFFAREGLLFGSPAEVSATTARMIEAQPFLGPLAADPSLRGIAATLSTILIGVEQGQASLGRIEPAMGRLADVLEADAARRPAHFSWQALLGSRQGLLAAPTRQLLLVRPKLDYGALMPGEASSAAIRAAATRLALDPAHGVTVRLTGSVPLADEELASLADRWWLVAGAMIAAMLVTLWLATRSLRVTSAILVTAIIGLTITTALGLALVGRFTLISVAFIPLFVGLGIDFGIQLAVRFQAERHDGRSPTEAIVAATERLGPALLLAAGAVCLGLLAFLPTAYRGIAELGLIAGIGMIVALIASVTLLPALLLAVRPGRPRAEVGSRAMAPLDRLLERRRKPILWLFALSLVASIASLPFVRFDFNPLHLRAADSESMSTLTELMRDPDRNPNTVDILAPDAARAKTLTERLGQLPEVERVVSLLSFVPDRQTEKLAAIGDARMLLDLTLNPFETPPPPSDGETVAALRTAAAGLIGAAARTAGGTPAADARRLAAQLNRLAHAAPAERFRAAAILVPPLETMLAQTRASLEATPVTVAALPESLTREWRGANGELKLQVVPKRAYADNRGLARFTKAVLAVAPDASGTAVSTQGAAHTIAMAFVQAGALALGIVTLLLFVALRDIREVAFTLAPVVLSGFLTLGTCVVIGLPINFANIIAFPLLFGVGVAFHIYFVMAWRSGATDLLQSSLARAIFFSALATGTAFGSLWLSHHPGTASMGQLLMLSLVWTLICALIFEPALLGPPRRENES